MSAGPNPPERLLEAARLMRERADAATGGRTDRWDNLPAGVGVSRVFCGQVLIAKTDETLGGIDHNAGHIASWRPAAALAVADWLEVTARDVGTSSLAYHAASAVVDVYLGEVS